MVQKSTRSVWVVGRSEGRIYYFLPTIESMSGPLSSARSAIFWNLLA